MDDPTVINRTIYQEMDRLRLSPKDLAEKLGIRSQTVYKWRNGDITPPVSRWNDIEAALELPHGTFAVLTGLVPRSGAASDAEMLEALRQRVAEIAADVSAVLGDVERLRART